MNSLIRDTDGKLLQSELKERIKKKKMKGYIKAKYQKLLKRERVTRDCHMEGERKHSGRKKNKMKEFVIRFPGASLPRGRGMSSVWISFSSSGDEPAKLEDIPNFQLDER